MTKKILGGSLVLGFVIYWALSFLFVTPANYLRDSAKPVFKAFAYVNGEKWTFFTPPPTFDLRLYYTFTSATTGEGATFEVLEPIVKGKQRKAPFNDGEHALDYVMFGAMQRFIRLTHTRAAVAAKVRRGLFHGGGISTNEMPDSTTLRFEDLQTSAGRTLINYAVVVAKAHNIDLRDTKVSFTGNAQMLPPFAERSAFLTGAKLKERLIFRSELFDIPPEIVTSTF